MAAATDIATYVERAKTLAPALKNRAAETEERRRLPPQTEKELHEQGLFRMWQPKRIGGGELDYVAFIDVVEEIASKSVDLAAALNRLSSLRRRRAERVLAQDIETEPAAAIETDSSRQTDQDVS